MITNKNLDPLCLNPDFDLINERFKIPNPFESEDLRPIVSMEAENVILMQEVCPQNPNLREIRITDLQNNNYALACQNPIDIINIRFMSGKFGKASAILDPRDNEFSHLRILATEDSYIHSTDNFTVKIYGKNIKKDDTEIHFNIDFNNIRRDKEDTIPSDLLIENHSQEPSVAKRLLLTTAETAYPESVENAIKSYFENGIYNSIPADGKFAGQYKHKYAIFIPAAGKGTRLCDATWSVGNIAKPAMPLPAKIKGHDYLLIQDTLVNLTRAGILGEETQIEIHREDLPLGSASGLIHSLQKKSFDTDTPLIVRQSDAFTDIDFSVALKEFEDSNAGVLLVGMPVDANMLKYVGVLCITEDNEVFNFLEKPGNTILAEPACIKNNDKYKDKYLGSIGMYIFSPYVLKWLQARVDESKDFFIGQDGTFDFAHNILPKTMNALRNGEITDSHGTPLKMRAAITDCNWSDFGSTFEYINELRKAAAIPPEHGGYSIPPDIRDQFKNNIDLESGVICLKDTKADFENFCLKYNIEAKGNILITRK